MKKYKGFTLIELLLVIAIIGLLSSIVLASLRGATEKAKIARTKAELSQLKRAVLQLEIDTDKWVNGCVPYNTDDPEVNLDSPLAGLNKKPVCPSPPAPCCDFPPANPVCGMCGWTPGDLGKWNGPYIQMSSIKDPWGNPYMFDPDYVIYMNCSSSTDPDKGKIKVAVISAGPDGDYYYGCDDIFMVLY